MNRSKTTFAKCFVPSCNNTTTNSREKLFLLVNDDLKKKWCKKLGIEYSSRRMLCCEDHLNRSKCECNSHVKHRHKNCLHRKMPSCVLRKCHNYLKKFGRDDGISYHRFPKDKEMLQVWIVIVRRERRDNDWFPTKDSRICSNHFTEDQIYKTATGRIYLKNIAVPDIKDETTPACSDPDSLQELEEDLKNYHYFQLMKGKPLLKPTAKLRIPDLESDSEGEAPVLKSLLQLPNELLDSSPSFSAVVKKEINNDDVNAPAPTSSKEYPSVKNKESDEEDKESVEEKMPQDHAKMSTPALDLVEDIKEANAEYCCICLRTTDERRMVKPVAVKIIMEELRLAVDDFIELRTCYMCEARARAALKTMNAIKLSFALNFVMKRTATATAVRALRRAMKQEPIRVSYKELVRQTRKCDAKIASVRNYTRFCTTEVLVVGSASETKQDKPKITTTFQKSPPKVTSEVINLDDDDDDDTVSAGENDKDDPQVIIVQPAEINKKSLPTRPIPAQPIPTQPIPAQPIQTQPIERLVQNEPPAKVPRLIPIEKLLSPNPSNLTQMSVLPNQDHLLIKNRDSPNLVLHPLIMGVDGKYYAPSLSCRLSNGVVQSVSTDVINAMIPKTTTLSITNIENEIQKRLSLGSQLIESAQKLSGGMQPNIYMNDGRILLANGNFISHNSGIPNLINQGALTQNINSILSQNNLDILRQSQNPENANLGNKTYKELNELTFSDDQIGDCKIILSDEDQSSLNNGILIQNVEGNVDMDNLPENTNDSEKIEKDRKEPRIDWEDKIPMDVISFVDATDPNADDIMSPNVANDPKTHRQYGRKRK